MAEAVLQASSGTLTVILRKGIVMKVYKNQTRKYYKQVDTVWTQPTLTENGTFGGSNMAVDWSLGGNNYSSGTPYTAFSPNTGGLYVYADEYKTWMRIFIYYPTPIKVTNISFRVDTVNSASGPATNTKFYAGNFKGDTLNLLKDIGTVNDGSSYSGDISVSTMYQYFVLYAENGGVGNADSLNISNILINGMHTDITEVKVSEDWTYYKDVDVYSAIDANNTYNVVKG